MQFHASPQDGATAHREDAFRGTLEMAHGMRWLWGRAGRKGTDAGWRAERAVQRECSGIKQFRL